MDWAKAIEINQTTLTRIVAELIAMVGIASERLPRPVYRAVMLVLRPAESAVRRLIIASARGVVVKLSPTRPMPKGISIAKKGSISRISFQLFDSRKRFGRRRRKSGPKLVPRVRFIDFSPLVPLFQKPSQYDVEPTPKPDDGTVSAARLSRRLAAIKDALEDLPRQAQRLVRWQARRNKMQSPKFRDPLRPGWPPGYRKRHRHEVDAVLTECRWLARDAFNPDTS
jgi:hypothetical protein